LFIKYNASPRELSRGEGGRSWTFVFGINQLQQIKRRESDKIFIALVCGAKNIKDREMQICLLYPDNIQEIFDLTDIAT
jgi:hypothetical protein